MSDLSRCQLLIGVASTAVVAAVAAPVLLKSLNVPLPDWGVATIPEWSTVTGIDLDKLGAEYGVNRSYFWRVVGSVVDKASRLVNMNLTTTLEDDDTYRQRIVRVRVFGKAPPEEGWTELEYSPETRALLSERSL